VRSNAVNELDVLIGGLTLTLTDAMFLEPRDVLGPLVPAACHHLCTPRYVQQGVA
jgi:hypothetical protein